MTLRGVKMAEYDLTLFDPARGARKTSEAALMVLALSDESDNAETLATSIGSMLSELYSDEIAAAAMAGALRVPRQKRHDVGDAVHGWMSVWGVVLAEAVTAYAYAIEHFAEVLGCSRNEAVAQVIKLATGEEGPS
jgi:hypothetical protein